MPGKRDGQLIIIPLYAAVIWLIFFRMKWLPFNWLYGAIAGVVGVATVLTFVGLLSYLTPSGRIGDAQRQRAGHRGSVQRNALVKGGTVLFQIDRAPYEYKVRQLTAALAEARQKVEQLRADVDVAAADVKALDAQWARAEKRRQDLEQLGQRAATSPFNVEDATA